MRGIRPIDETSESEEHTPPKRANTSKIYSPFMKHKKPRSYNFKTSIKNIYLEICISFKILNFIIKYYLLIKFKTFNKTIKMLLIIYKFK